MRTWSMTIRNRAAGFLLAGLCANYCLAQTALTWTEVRDRFEARNPTLKAAQLNIEESRAAEITANLRPNPDLTGNLDQINPLASQASPSTGASVFRPFAYALPLASVTYLHEREHKRELRFAGAKKSTEIA